MLIEDYLSRQRQKEGIRRLFSETTLLAKDFILPIFVKQGGEKVAIASLPGVYQIPLSGLDDEVQEAVDCGVFAVLLFGVSDHKTSDARAAFDDEGLIQKAITQIKKKFPHLLVMADCCLCEYTDHGHCFIHTQGKSDSSLTREVLGNIAISYAKAGVDVVAPSGMVDGMVSFLRQALNANGYTSTLIFSYAVKYASYFYGPFREAAGSGQFSGHRLYHQLGVSQKQEGLLEAEMDVKEGADALIIKPAGFYLDMVSLIKQRTLLPLIGYHVSGEYAMVKLSAQAHILQEKEAFFEIYTCMKRAGVTGIISYAAKDMCKWLNHF